MKYHVLMLHGLNLDPLKLCPIADFLRSHKIKVDLPALSGHKNNVQKNDPFPKLYQLQKEVNNYIHSSYQKACQENKKLAVFCYSFSSILLVKSIKETKIVPDKIIFLSPPFYPKKILSHFLFPIFSFIPILKVPSFNLKEYRLNTFLPLAFYKELLEEIQTLQMTEIKDIDCLCLIHKNDEFIDCKKLINKMHDKKNMQILVFKDKKRGIPNHLKIDSFTFSRTEYLYFQEVILEHLD